TGVGAITLFTQVGCSLSSKDSVPDDVGMLPTPPAEELTPPETPIDQFQTCFNVDEFVGLRLSATDAMYPGSNPVEGSSIFELAPSKCITGQNCTQDNKGVEFKLDSTNPRLLKFEGVFRWASSPWELHQDNPNRFVFGDPEYSETTQRAGLRVSGEALANLVFYPNGVNEAVNWASIYPNTAHAVGLVYFVSGEVNTEDCSYLFQLRPAVRTVDELAEADAGVIPIPIYSRRVDGKEGLAAPDMSNETIVMVPLEADQSISVRGRKTETGPNQAQPIDVGDATVGILRAEPIIETRNSVDVEAPTPMPEDEPDAGGLTPLPEPPQDELDPPDAGN
ncbi:MAG: hypothetical protein R3330_15275, partial [Saprospiraceae bacterium]|nr:hypothetical protein [Saprospiraceae bacterium]